MNHLPEEQYYFLALKQSMAPCIFMNNTKFLSIICKALQDFASTRLSGFILGPSILFTQLFSSLQIISNSLVSLYLLFFSSHSSLLPPSLCLSPFFLPCENYIFFANNGPCSQSLTAELLNGYLSCSSPTSFSLKYLTPHT